MTTFLLPLALAAGIATSPSVKSPAFVMTLDSQDRAVCSGPTVDQRDMIRIHHERHQEELDLDVDYLLDSYRERALVLKFSGVPTRAKDAIRAAVNIWDEHLFIPVTFTLKFYWEDFEERESLAFARGGYDEDEEEGWLVCFKHLDDGCVPTTLGNQLANERIIGKTDPDPEFEIHINEDADWYLGVDGNPGEDEFDLVTVLLHEIGHALGFSASFSVDHDEETGEFWEWESDDYFVYYDQFVWNRGDGDLMDLENPSDDLYGALTGHKLFWGHFRMKNSRGEALMSVRENGGPVMVWSSPDEDTGSRVSHLDFDAFPAFHRDGLMNPYASRGAANHKIGPVTLGMLYDLGWELRERTINAMDVMRCLEGGSGASGETADPEEEESQLTWSFKFDVTPTVTDYQWKAQWQLTVDNPTSEPVSWEWIKIEFLDEDGYSIGENTIDVFSQPRLTPPGVGANSTVKFRGFTYLPIKENIWWSISSPGGIWGESDSGWPPPEDPEDEEMESTASITYKIRSKDSSRGWEFAWKISVYNGESGPRVFYLTVDFLDEDGYAIDTFSHYTSRFPAKSTKTDSGTRFVSLLLHPEQVHSAVVTIEDIWH